MKNQVLPLVSIGMPTFNRANSYLSYALKSALAQTYPNIEIIVSDNCSSDHTPQLVRDFQDDRVRYFRQSRNIGPNNNNNFCLEQARGEFFLLLHDDDLIDLDFIETCVNAANYDSNVGIIRTGVRVIDGEGYVRGGLLNRVVGLSIEDFILGWFNAKTWICLPNTIFSTKRLRELGGFHSKNNLVVDALAEMKLAGRFGRVDVEEIKASTRQHEGELTFSVKLANWCEDSQELLDLMCELGSKKKDQIQRDGLKFFSKSNYRRAGSNRKLLERIRLYFFVYKTFDYQYSPLMFFIGRNNLYRKTRGIIRRLVNLVDTRWERLASIKF